MDFSFCFLNIEKKLFVGTDKPSIRENYTVYYEKQIA